jgi:hypothetical protein
MAKKSPFQVGTRVRIVTPERFVRCGYPMTPAIAAKELMANHEQDIIEFLEKLGIAQGLTEVILNPSTDGPKKVLRAEHRAVKRLAGDLGYFYTGAKGFGGRERKIFTTPSPEDEGLIGFISESRSVMTGHYYGPSGGYDSYSGEYDYDPGGLDGMKSNRIHRLSLYRDTFDTDPEYAQFPGNWYEQRCLEVVPE